MPDPQIFKATYSGVPVYEMMCKGVAVMRRRSDSWLNATQILKVAGYDKPQRTRVLEREVQKGEHEKVQGGYGKYQGTWIPLQRGLELAKQYNCEHLLRPIIEYTPTAKSPPPAPKHLAASNSGSSARPPRRANATKEHTPSSVVNTRSSRRQPDPAEEDSDRRTFSLRGSEDGTMTPSPSDASSSSHTPSPINSPVPSAYAARMLDIERHTSSPAPGRNSHYPMVVDELYEDPSDGEASRLNGAYDPRGYADQILEYFISDTSQPPQLLISPPPDFDPNMTIDDDGHTALHWACAMGRVRVVKLLLTAGADIFKVNHSGQTSLMRSVMFANNYDVRKFPELYELLHRSTLNIDNSNRTVFHHIVDVAMSKGKTHAARYYMETVLNRLADYPKELADVINFQDEDGETALTLAARCRSKRLVKILIDHGADPKVVNHDGKSAEDYILEDERLRASPPPPTRVGGMSFRNAQAAYPPPGAAPGYAFAPANGDRPPLHLSVAAQHASTRCVNDVTTLLDSLAASFDQELKEKTRDTQQAHALLANIQAEILESQRAVAALKQQADELPQAKQRLKELEGELLRKMGLRCRLGWEKWVKDEEAREKAIRDAADGELMITPATATYRVEEDGQETEGGPSPPPPSSSSAPLPTPTPLSPDASDKGKGKRKAPPPPTGAAATQLTEDISDLLALHADIPEDAGALHEACEALREEIGQHRKRRRDMLDELVACQAEAGTSGKMSEYRRLIGAGCGGIPPAEVDHVLGMLLEASVFSLFSIPLRLSLVVFPLIALILCDLRLSKRRNPARPPPGAEGATFAFTVRRMPLLVVCKTQLSIRSRALIKSRVASRFCVHSRLLLQSFIRKGRSEPDEPPQTMPHKGLPFSAVVKPITTHPWTCHFRHLEPVPRHWYKKVPPWLRVDKKAIPPKDRIKFWNIVPGDKIRLRDDQAGNIREVIGISKLDNGVYLQKTKGDKSDVGYPRVNYARCQLYMGMSTRPSKDDVGGVEVPVFALRLGKRNVAWSRHLGRWNWHRIALATVPRLPKTEEPRVIPWPKHEKEKPPPPTSYDTRKEALLEITYSLPPLPGSLADDLPARPSEHAYIRSLRTDTAPYDAARPMEIAIARELANPHSRAKRQARWQARSVADSALLDEHVRGELGALTGRTARVARAEAVWKWREIVAARLKAHNARRMRTKEALTRLERKKRRKARKVEKQRLKLGELVLSPGKNQVIPPGVRMTSRPSASQAM